MHFGQTEPNAGSDAGGTETTAQLVGDHYILNGEKIFITNGGEADTLCGIRSNYAGYRHAWNQCVYRGEGLEGFTIGDHYDKLGIRSSATAQLLFNDVKVPKENLPAKRDRALRLR